MVSDVTRYVPAPAQRELWARAAGRCQFDGHNRLLYSSCVTQEAVNVAQKAHIYAFSEKGPRGRGPYKDNLDRLNDVSNLMLMCYDCHTKIDQDKEGLRYSAELLIQWKELHEQRIEIVTGIAQDKKSHVVLYGANIGSEKTLIEYHDCVRGMFPHRYPASERPIQISTKSEIKDNSSQYWQAESLHLLNVFQKKIVPIIDDDACKHFSLFALAPQPLLVQLGALFTDKISVEGYQPHREPKGWRWHDCGDEFDYVVHRPERNHERVALIVSLSDNVPKDRITRVIGDDVSIWEITVENPHNDLIKAKQQVSMFRQRMRSLIVEIKKQHGAKTPLHIFPVMPVSCSIELGRIRMPKVDMPWLIYDHDVVTQEFVKALEIKGDLYDD
ncbi:MAG: SAVED domain-containing protein [Pseudomonadota bacterium]|nr:SAVED domain-containing protein [Pseudomonadota bacterium]QKK05111.1 MAG: SAVED domain-containing protein [Pseudomonadota bacterium]